MTSAGRPALSWSRLPESRQLSPSLPGCTHPGPPPPGPPPGGGGGGRAGTRPHDPSPPPTHPSPPPRGPAPEGGSACPAATSQLTVRKTGHVSGNLGTGPQDDRSTGGVQGTREHGNGSSASADAAKDHREADTDTFPPGDVEQLGFPHSVDGSVNRQAALESSVAASSES